MGTSGDPTLHRLVGRVGVEVVRFDVHSGLPMPVLVPAVVTVEVASGGGGGAFARVCGLSKKPLIELIEERVGEKAAGWMVEELAESLY